VIWYTTRMPQNQNYGTRLEKRFMIGWRKQGSDAPPQQTVTWKSWLCPDYVLTAQGVRSSSVWIVTRSRFACYRRFGPANRFNILCVATGLRTGLSRNSLSISGKTRDFLYSKMSIPVLGPTQSAIQRVSRGNVRSVRVAGGAWNYIAAPYTWLWDFHKDNLTCHLITSCSTECLALH
jgi:hypothetical protein